MAQEKTISLTEKQLKDIVKFAHHAGEMWGVTYSGWFMPNEEDQKERLEACISSVLEFNGFVEG